jgi:hypothetical protein
VTTPSNLTLNSVTPGPLSPLAFPSAVGVVTPIGVMIHPPDHPDDLTRSPRVTPSPLTLKDMTSPPPPSVSLTWVLTGNTLLNQSLSFPQHLGQVARVTPSGFTLRGCTLFSPHPSTFCAAATRWPLHSAPSLSRVTPSGLTVKA